MNELFDMVENTPGTSHLTKILILNALFEAARAGEAGKALATTADELRELTAQKTTGTE